jgi:hypothetical protein
MSEKEKLGVVTALIFVCALFCTSLNLNRLNPCHFFPKGVLCKGYKLLVKL